MECSLICTQEEEQQRYNELPSGIRALLKNMQKVDSWACLDPVEEEDGHKIWDPMAVPFDHTDLGNHVVLSGGVNAFALKTPKRWGKKKNETEDDEEMVLPEIYFTLSFSSDKDPHKILDRVAGEWGKIGGKKLFLKNISSFNTRTAVNIFHLRNDNDAETIKEEFRLILEEAKEIAEVEDAENAMEYFMREIPDLSIRKLMPKIVGQDTKAFQGWSGGQHEMRKVLAIEADDNDVEMIHYLVETAKNRRLFEKYWGFKARVTAVLDNRNRKKGSHKTQQMVDMAAVASYSRKHINYMASTRMDGIRGIFHLDKKVSFFSASNPLQKMGDITLRWLLYRELKMSDGHCLFEELHQSAPMGAVDVAVPNCEEAERMMLMLQRNAAAFFSFYLQENTELPEELIEELISKSMDPILVNSISSCKWDREKWVLATPEDEEQEKRMKMEEAAWYSDVFGDNMVDASRKEKLQYANKEALDELHCDHSYKLIHHRKGSYVGSPEAESFQVGNKANAKKGGEEVVGQEDSFENLSPAELIAMLKKHNISPSGTVGSPPNVERSGSGRGSEVEELSSDSSSSSTDSSDSDSDESMASGESKDASPSRDEGDTTGRKPDQGG